MSKSLAGYREKIPYNKNLSVNMYLGSNSEEVPCHYHNAFEIIMPIDGECCVIIGDTVHILSPNDVLFIAPSINHSIQRRGKGQHYLLNVNTSIFKEVPESQDLLQSFSSYAIYDSSINATSIELLNRRIEMLWEHYQSNAPYKYFHFYASIMVLFAIAGRINLEDTFHNRILLSERHIDKYKDELDAICKYIDDHCVKKLRAQDIAAEYGFSLSHFNRLFVSYTGMSFSSYLNKQRISFAKKLLCVEKEATIITIGMQSGFSSISSFNRIFKMETGITPSEYRNTHYV